MHEKSDGKSCPYSSFYRDLQSLANVLVSGEEERLQR